MKIAIFGLGYVGLTAAVCLAKQGHMVFGVDISEEKVKQTNAGVSPIKEPGLSDLLKEVITKGALRCTTDPAAPLGECDMAIVCVGTPSGLDGAHNMNFIAEVSRKIARAINKRQSNPLTVVFRSTVRPGTVEELILPIFEAVLGKGAGASYELVYNPEFLRESTAIKDFFNPPKIVVGTASGARNKHMDEMHKNLDVPVFYTKFREAEITKFADNTFHALKVAFANELGRICQKLDIDVGQVHKIFISDTKLNISPYYLRPGAPFGGSCLPKDVRALQYISGEIGANTHVIDAILQSNEAHKHYTFQRASLGLSPGSRVLLLGLAFKSNSDDLRESPHIYLARRLIEIGHRLSVYDPYLRPDMLVGQNLGYAYTYLPTINDLLIARDEVEGSHYDLVIDASGDEHNLKMSFERFLDISRMQ